MSWINTYLIIGVLLYLMAAVTNRRIWENWRERPFTVVASALTFICVWFPVMGGIILSMAWRRIRNE